MEAMEKTVARVKKPQNMRKERSIVIKAVLITCALVLIALLDANVGMLSSFQSSVASRSKLQAIFLSNGQVYFGHLAPHGMNTYVLRNAYYLRSTRIPVSGAEEGKEPQFQTQNELVKTTRDVHGPENDMFIPREQILFWQNLRSDSDVVRTITSSR